MLISHNSRVIYMIMYDPQFVIPNKRVLRCFLCSSDEKDRKYVIAEPAPIDQSKQISEMLGMNKHVSCILYI